MRLVVRSPEQTYLLHTYFPSHIGREGEKLPYQYFTSQQANALAAAATFAGMTDAQNGVSSAMPGVNLVQGIQSQPAINAMKYYQLTPQQRLFAAAANGSMDRSLAMSFDRTGDMSRLSSPFYMRLDLCWYLLIL